MTSSGDQATSRGAGSLASRCRKLAGFTFMIALVCTVLFQIDGAFARGLSEDIRLDLSLDFEDLVDSDAKKDSAKSSGYATRDRQFPTATGAAPNGGPRWERDPAFLSSREQGYSRNPETNFRDSEFGNEVRRLLGR